MTDRARRKMRFFGLGMVVLIFTIACVSEKADGAPSGKAEAVPPSVVSPAIKTEPVASSVSTEKKDTPASAVNGASSETTAEVDDPFATKMAAEPSVFETPEKSDVPEIKVMLEGIGMGTQGTYAVLNGDVYYVGEEKKGIKMVEVRRGEVDIIVGGNPRTVPVFLGEDLKLAQERQQKKNEKEISTQAPKVNATKTSAGAERAAL